MPAVAGSVAGDDVAGNAVSECVRAVVRDHENRAIVAEYMLQNPLHTDALGEYNVLISDWLPRQIARARVEVAFDAQKHVLEFRQMRLLQPIMSNTDGRIFELTADESYVRRATWSAHVCVDIVHVSHTYKRPETVRGVLEQQTNDARKSDSADTAGNRDDAFSVVIGKLLQGKDREFYIQHIAFRGNSSSSEEPARKRERTEIPSRKRSLMRVQPTPEVCAMEPLVNKHVVCLFKRHTAVNNDDGVGSDNDEDDDTEDAESKKVSSLVVHRVGAYNANRSLYGVTSNIGSAVEFDDRLIVSSTAVVNVQVPLFDLPLLLGLSPLDGYGRDIDSNTPLTGSMIVNGCNLQVSNQLQGTINHPIVQRHKAKSKWSFSVECRALEDNMQLHSTRTFCMRIRCTTGRVHCTVPNRAASAMTDIPLEHLLVLLGVEDVDMFLRIVRRTDAHWKDAEWMNEVALEMQFPKPPLNQRRALATHVYASRMQRSVDAMLAVFDESLLPHCDSAAAKQSAIAGMLWQLAAAAARDREVRDDSFQTRVVDDRDDAQCKQVHGTGKAVGFLVRQLFQAWSSEMANSMRKSLIEGKFITAREVASRTRFGKRINVHLNTKHFSTGGSDQKKGALHPKLEGTNSHTPQAQLHRVTSTVKSSNKNIKLRLLRGTHWTKLCPCDTPEGENTGVINAQCFVAQTSRGVSFSLVRSIVQRLSLVEALVRAGDAALPQEAETAQLWGVCVNSCLVGHTKCPHAFSAEWRRLRRKCSVPPCVSVHTDLRRHAVMLRCEEGRLMTPLFVVANATETRVTATIAKAKRFAGVSLTDALLREGLVEFIDSFEQLETVIAFSRGEADPQRHTHALLHPITTLSATTAMSVFCNHNQTPRSVYFTSQYRQTMGWHNLRDPSKWSTTHLLSMCMPQRPVVRTLMHDIISSFSEVEPVDGFTPIVAFLTNGFTIDDAIIFKKEAIGRGMGAYFDVHNKTITTPHNSDIALAKPPEYALRKKLGSAADRDVYAHIDDEGLPRVGACIRAGDVLLGRVRTFQEFDTQGRRVQQVRCCSVLSSKEGKVDAVEVRNTTKGMVVSVRLVKMEFPREGDKFTDRHAQKGVISLIVPERDLPRTMHGVTPDVIFSGAGLITRMTVGKVMEMLFSKAAAVYGKSASDGSPWQRTLELRVTEAVDELRQHGFHAEKERMINGLTGEMMEGFATIGPMHMMALKHLSKPKAYAHGRTGAVDSRTRQPKPGRALEGGMQMGEMEMQALVALGMSLTSAEFTNSNPYTAFLCVECGHVGAPPPVAVFRTTESQKCKHCGVEGVMEPVRGTYTEFCVLINVLASMGIDVKFKLRKKSLLE